MMPTKQLNLKFYKQQIELQSRRHTRRVEPASTKQIKLTKKHETRGIRIKVVFVFPIE